MHIFSKYVFQVCRTLCGQKPMNLLSVYSLFCLFQIQIIQEDNDKIKKQLHARISKLLGCHKINLPEGFVCNRFLSIILLKQICLFKPFVSLLLSYPLFCQILIFYFKTLIQISFLIFIAKLMLIIPSCFKLFDKNVTAFFFLILFPFYLLHIYPSVDFLSKYLIWKKFRSQESTRNFFHGH